MRLYWSLNKLPELRQRSWMERQQAVWQVGLKPFRHLQVWGAMLLTALVTLWALETLVGNVLWSPALSASAANPLSWTFALLLAAAFTVTSLATLIFMHAYLKALRPYLGQVSFNRRGSALRALAGSTVINLAAPVLIVAIMTGLDLAINSLDASPDPRMAAITSWPEPIPASANGAIAAAGLMAPPGASPFDAGERWITATNDAARKHTHDFPPVPDGLKYAAYLSKAQAEAEKKGGKPVKPKASAQFCEIGSESCWKAVRQDPGAVNAWLGANQELLARYQALQKYPQWQYAISPGSMGVPIPPYQALIRGQSLFLASAMLAFDKKQAGKGLDMIGADLRFVRTFMAGEDTVIAKMVASAMLTRDLAVLAETLQERPGDLKPYWAQLENMLEPLTPRQVSPADAFRFEERWMASHAGADDFAQALGAPIALTWEARRHYRPNASANMMVEFWETAIRQTEVTGTSYTPPIAKQDALSRFEFSRWFGFMHNQTGKFLVLDGLPEYHDYANRLFDVNALNALVRLKLALAKNHVAAQDVPAFLKASGKTVWNPETGKPFEWDAARKQIYFVPAADITRRRYTLGSGVPGRVGLPAAQAAP